MPDPRRSGAGDGRSATLGNGSRFNRASDQDADRPGTKRRLRFSGLALSRQQEVAAQEKPSEIAGKAASANAAHARMELGSDCRQGQSGPARLARLLPGEPFHGPERPGRMVASSPAGDAAQAGEATWLRAERGRQ